jgi:hypothetical protein
MPHQVEYGEQEWFELYLDIANSCDIMRKMNEYQDGNRSRRKLCQDIAEHLYRLGYRNKP